MKKYKSSNTSMNRCTIYIHHANGHWKDQQSVRHSVHRRIVKSIPYDRIEGSVSPYRDIVYWNRRYQIGKKRAPVLPDGVVIWHTGTATEYKFNKCIMKIVNKILTLLPKKWIKKNNRWPLLKC
jgi:hypothetical protein